LIAWARGRFIRIEIEKHFLVIEVRRLLHKVDTAADDKEIYRLLCQKQIERQIRKKDD